MRSELTYVTLPGCVSDHSGLIRESDNAIKIREILSKTKIGSLFFQIKRTRQWMWAHYVCPKIYK